MTDSYLTEREEEVLSRLQSGKSYEDIGEELGITQGTVKGYVSRVGRKRDRAVRTVNKLIEFDRI